MSKIILENLTQQMLEQVSELFYQHRNELPSIFQLIGDLGTGKTTFSRAFIAKAENADTFASPTYTLVNEYQLPKGKINHFDLYRVTMADYDLIYEYLDDKQQISLLEWANLHAELFLDYETISLYFQYVDTEHRSLIMMSNCQQVNKIKELLAHECIIFKECDGTNGIDTCNDK